MASEAESSVLGGGASEGGDDPHANYRIDDYTYLVIEEDGGYDISYYTAKEIPEGVVVEKDPIDTCLKGRCHFRVRKYGLDTFDHVTVGTITVQHGFAYIAGCCVGDDIPDRSNEFLFIPPFVISHPVQPPPYDPKEFCKEMAYRVHIHLREQVAEYATLELPCHRDIDLTRPFSLQQKNCCKTCKEIMYEGGYETCEFCYNETLEDESGVTVRPCAIDQTNLCRRCKVEMSEGSSNNDHGEVINGCP